MSLVSSLLRAIVRADGEVLVLHVGDRPYVVSSTGQVEVATHGLTLPAVAGIVAELLPPESRAALDQFGAAQHELAPMPEFPGERFTVVAARGGSDVWAEIRRRRPVDLEPARDEPVADVTAGAAAPSGQDATSPPARAAAQKLAAPAAPPTTAPQMSSPAPPSRPGAAAPAAPAGAPGAPPTAARASSPAESAPAREADKQVSTPPVAPPKPGATPRAPAYMATRPVRRADPPHGSRPGGGPAAAPMVEAQPVPPGARPTAGPPEPAPAVILPLSRSPIRPDVPPALGEGVLPSLDRLLRLGAARGASTLYLSSGARPSVRVDGAIQMLEGAPVVGAHEVEALLLTLMPARHRGRVGTGGTTEWITDLQGVGRVRCRTFRDHRGPGGIFRIMPARAVTVDQLGISREMQALAFERNGLVIVAGPRSSGKRTLMSALVDLVNRSRRDHVITVESEIQTVHDPAGSLISQREVRGRGDEVVTAVQAALREDPDILVIEELRSAAVMDLALEASSDQLVIGGFPASTASDAIDRILDLYGEDDRRRVQLSLAQHLRGVVAQILLPKTGGGRLAARELLLATPAVAGLLADGNTSQLPLAIEGGRRDGMVPMNDAIVGFVQSGAVEVREAYRRSPDRPGLLALLKRQGLDTSFAERLA